ncbi:DUF3021 domain-containing protein [bacterium 1xD8-48]|nr:DUF3021 domain-containing protein [Lachnospiraceae bacterium]MCI9325721.1 DUF3021 domain-containing protein [Lachnospiraceae bacterium]NBJ98930.1 DUF3021 domain-containing protein [bacterium 1xD8-48]
MKRTIILRSLLGAPIGLTISYLISVFISLAIRDGNYYPIVPELAEICGNEINAILLQTVCSLLVGTVYGGASVIWQIEGWSLMRMTVTHLAVCSAAMFPIAYFMQWMPHSFGGFLRYFGIFFGIYFCIWGSQYFSMKRKIEMMNQKVREQN